MIQILRKLYHILLRRKIYKASAKALGPFLPLRLDYGNILQDKAVYRCIFVR